MTIYGRSKLTHRLVTRGGTPVGVDLWNPTAASIAHFMECDEDEVEWSEDDETGVETVTVRGKVVGQVEWF